MGAFLICGMRSGPQPPSTRPGILREGISFGLLSTLTLSTTRRAQMGITSGTRLPLSLGADGALAVRIQTRGADSLFGLLSAPNQTPKSLPQMDQAISAAVGYRSSGLR